MLYLGITISTELCRYAPFYPFTFLLFYLFTLLPFYLFTFLPFQILFHIRLNLLEFGRELVEGVLLHHHFHLSQTVLIASHLGACLLGMDSPGTDFILPDIAQGIADALHQRANHQVEKMMPLYI